MDCKDVRNNLTAYADGELAEGLRYGIGEHLERCSGCRTAFARGQHLTTMITEAAAPSVPDDLTARIMAQLRARKEPLPTKRVGIRFNRWNLRVIGERAAAAAVLVIGLALGGYMGSSTGGKPAAAPEMQLTAQVDPVETYNLDYLTPAPENSIERAFMTLTSLSEENAVKK